jgi:hypothetical protein
LIYSSRSINDHDLLKVLLNIRNVPVRKISFTNLKITEAGLMMLAECLKALRAINVLKIYNNIYSMISDNQELPFMIYSTQALSESLNGTKLL